MARIRIRLATLSLLVLALSPSFGRQTVLAADEAGFTPLFNGKNLEGWVTPEDKGLFTVDNGEIVGKTRGDLKKNEFLVTARPYGDFVLKAKVLFKSGNSGIQFRSKRSQDGAVSGPQADVAEGWWGTLYEERGRGILDKFDPKQAEALVKEGDWNEFTITARGDHVTVALNGKTINDVKDPTFARSGIIAFQVHQGPPMEVRFKDVVLKSLD